MHFYDNIPTRRCASRIVVNSHLVECYSAQAFVRINHLYKVR